MKTRHFHVRFSNGNNTRWEPRPFQSRHFSLVFKWYLKSGRFCPAFKLSTISRTAYFQRNENRTCPIFRIPTVCYSDIHYLDLIYNLMLTDVICRCFVTKAPREKLATKSDARRNVERRRQENDVLMKCITRHLKDRNSTQWQNCPDRQ